MIRRLPCLVFVGVSLLVARTAEGQDRPLTAVLHPTASGANATALGDAFERVLRARLDSLGVVTLSGTPAVSFSDLQLAVGCLGETNECFSAIAAQLGVQAMVLTNVQVLGTETIVTVSFVDTREAAAPGQVVRRASGEGAEQEILDAIEGMLRELFDLPEPEPPPEILMAPSVPAVRDPQPRDQAPTGSSFPIVPVIVMGAGVAIAGTGAIFGLLASGSESDYESAPTTTAADVDHALDLQSTAESQAMMANILLAVGAGTIATGIVLLFVMDSGDEESPVAVAPVVGPGAFGLSITGRFGGAL